MNITACVVTTESIFVILSCHLLIFKYSDLVRIHTTDEVVKDYIIQVKESVLPGNEMERVTHFNCGYQLLLQQYIHPVAVRVVQEPEIP